MKDIDFDELDRAVGSVLATETPKPVVVPARTQASTPSVRVAPVASVGSSAHSAPAIHNRPAATPSSILPGARTVPVAKPTVTTPSTSITPGSPAKRRGQFLDMVHPSADMSVKSPLPISHRKTLTPLNANITSGSAPALSPTPRPAAELASHPVPSPVAAPVSVVPTATASVDQISVLQASGIESEDAPVPSASLTPQAPSVATDTINNSATAGWPDPLDFVSGNDETHAAHETDQDENETPEATSGDNSSASIQSNRDRAAMEAISDRASDADSVIDADGSSEPLGSSQTPFVSDAKVDKRPLGAFAQADESQTPDHGEAAPPEDTSNQEGESDTDVSQKSAAHDSAESLAPELSADVNAVEAAGLSQADESAPTPDAISKMPTKPAALSSSVDEAPVPVADTGLVQSIPQQYKVAAPHSTPHDSTARPLFDTEDYHQPLLPDGKKKPKKGMLLAILLIVLLLVGGALGYVVYTMGF